MPPAMINLDQPDINLTANPLASAMLVAVLAATCFAFFSIMKKVFASAECLRLQDDIIIAAVLATAMDNAYMFYENLTASYLNDSPAFQAIATSFLNLSFLTLLHYLLPDGDPAPRAVISASMMAVLFHLGTFSMMMWSVTGWKG